MDYTSKGQGVLNTVLGSVGTFGTLAGAILPHVVGSGNASCSSPSDKPVNRYELGLYQENADLKSQIALRDANIYNDQKLLEVYKYFDGELKGVREELCNQRVYNATNTSAIGCIQGQIAQLYSLTKLVVPNTSVCPGWGNVTITPATTTAG